MKKILSFMLAFALLASFAACQTNLPQDDADASASPEPKTSQMPIEPLYTPLVQGSDLPLNKEGVISKPNLIEMMPVYDSLLRALSVGEYSEDDPLFFWTAVHNLLNNYGYGILGEYTSAEVKEISPESDTKATPSPEAPLVLTEDNIKDLFTVFFSDYDQEKPLPAIPNDFDLIQLSENGEYTFTQIEKPEEPAVFRGYDISSSVKCEAVIVLPGENGDYSTYRFVMVKGLNADSAYPLVVSTIEKIDNIESERIDGDSSASPSPDYSSGRRP